MVLYFWLQEYTTNHRSITKPKTKIILIPSGRPVITMKKILLKQQVRSGGAQPGLIRCHDTHTFTLADPFPSYHLLWISLRPLFYVSDTTVFTFSLFSQVSILSLFYDVPHPCTLLIFLYSLTNFASSDTYNQSHTYYPSDTLPFLSSSPQCVTVKGVKWQNSRHSRYGKNFNYPVTAKMIFDNQNFALVHYNFCWTSLLCPSLCGKLQPCASDLVWGFFLPLSLLNKILHLYGFFSFLVKR